MRCKAVAISVPAIILATFVCSGQDTMAQDQVAEGDQAFLLNYPNLDDSGGRVVLTNDYVVLQRLVVPAGEWEGVHSHPGNQIFVHIKGGEWSGRLGSEYEYREIASPDGEIGWMDAIPLSAGHDSGNTGDTPIDLIYVTLKRDAPIAPDADHVPQLYPDVATELLLHNHRMIVQRVILEPDQWTGIHSHPGNQVYIQIRGGSWSQRQGGEQAAPTALMEPGAATWVDAVAISAGHDEGNTGDTTLEFVVVTIK